MRAITTAENWSPRSPRGRILFLRFLAVAATAVSGEERQQEEAVFSEGEQVLKRLDRRVQSGARPAAGLSKGREGETP